MSFLNGSATGMHKSILPDGVTKEQALAVLHDHEAFLACNPHMSKFERAQSEAAPELPGGDKALPGTAEAFVVTDVISTLPAGLWDSNINSTYEFADTSDGMLLRVKSPLSIVMDTTWTVVEADGKLELREGFTIRCSRLLIGVVRSQGESNWPKIHSKMISNMQASSGGEAVKAAA